MSELLPELVCKPANNSFKVNHDAICQTSQLLILDVWNIANDSSISSIEGPYFTPQASHSKENVCKQICRIKQQFSNSAVVLKDP
jgi:hypothetical protein